MSIEPTLQARVNEELARLRRYRTDTRSVEAKSCAGGLSRGAVESVCAFAMIELCTVDGHPVVAAWIDALPASARPCHVLRRGLENGTYLRAHDGDRRANRYEVQVMLSSRTRPRDDVAIVPSARVEHLDAGRVDALVGRLRRVGPRVFGDADEARLLRLVGVCGDDPGSVTLAGLLALGTYPQQFFPQLNVTFVAYPTVHGEPIQDGRRFLDNQSIDGSVPVMVAEAMAALRRNMRRGAIITGAGREDRWDYPELAVRELLVNALTHRDYHPAAQGTQIRMSLYPDRLEIESPGGLWGALDADQLLCSPEPASRNERLAKLLEDVESDDERRPICENRGSGLLAAMTALRRSNREPPVVRDDVRKLTVVLRDRDVIDDDTRTWLRSNGLDPRAPAAHGLALMRRRGRSSVAAWRAATGDGEAEASAALDALRSAGLIERDDRAGGRGWRPTGGDAKDEVREAAARMFLRTGPRGPDAPLAPEGRRGDRRPRIRELLARAPRSTVALAADIGIGRAGVQRWLQRMEADGEVVCTDPGRRRSPNNRWRLCDS